MKQEMTPREMGESLARLGMSQADLARAVGRSRQTICGHMRGTTPVDSAIAAYLRYRVRVKRLIEQLDANDLME